MSARRLRITLQLPDGRVINDANFARVIIEDGHKAGAQSRTVESLVVDANDLHDLQMGTKVLKPLELKKQVMAG